MSERALVLPPRRILDLPSFVRSGFQALVVGNDVEAGDASDVVLVADVGPAESALIENVILAIELKQAEAQIAVVLRVDRLTSAPSELRTVIALPRKSIASL